MRTKENTDHHNSMTIHFRKFLFVTQISLFVCFLLSWSSFKVLFWSCFNPCLLFWYHKRDRMSKGWNAALDSSGTKSVFETLNLSVHTMISKAWVFISISVSIWKDNNFGDVYDIMRKEIVTLPKIIMAS